MRRTFDPFRLLAVSIAGWLNQQQRGAIDYLREETSDGSPPAGASNSGHWADHLACRRLPDAGIGTCTAFPEPAEPPGRACGCGPPPAAGRELFRRNISRLARSLAPTTASGVQASRQSILGAWRGGLRCGGRARTERRGLFGAVAGWIVTLPVPMG
jgi:hypothetical protein